VKKEYDVTEVDAEGPQLIGSEIEEGEVHLFVEDAGIGVDWRDIYARSSDGTLYYPVSYDEAEGEVVFEYPQENWDVYISDHIGNTLHLAFSLEN